MASGLSASAKSWSIGPKTARLQPVNPVTQAVEDSSPRCRGPAKNSRRRTPPHSHAHYFFSLSPEDRRAYSEQMATNFADPMTAAWPNWAKIFFNNKGVAATETDHCADYPAADQSVWDWSPAR